MENRNTNYTSKSTLNEENISELTENLKNSLSPEILDKLEIVSYVSKGGESMTYKGYIKNNNKNRKTALFKLIKKKNPEKEVKISSKLKNINVIDFFASTPAKKDESYLIIMEYAELGDLRNFQRNIVKQTIFPESMVNYIASQVLKGIEYCHRCKVAHMDIKPQNLVIDELLNIKLIDFSISINYKNNRKESIKLPLAGTNFYMPLEVLNESNIKLEFLHKVDLYSFGVVLFNLAFGCYPYGLEKGDENNYDIIRDKIQNNELSFDEEFGYSNSFLDFLRKLLEKDINKRISLYEAINHYWIKGADILYEEKDNFYNGSYFITHLLTDHISRFNDYVNTK